MNWENIFHGITNKHDCEILNEIKRLRNSDVTYIKHEEITLKVEKIRKRY